MTSINDVSDLPKLLEGWAGGHGYRGAFGIDAERSMAEDLRKLLSLTVHQARALEDSQERARALEQQLPTSEAGEPDPALSDPLEEAARLDRKARRDAQLARAALQQEVLAAYSRGVSKSVLSSVSGMTRQTVDRVLGQWKRKPPRFGDGETQPTLF